MASDTHASEGASASLPPREDLYRVDYSADMEVRDDGDQETVLAGHFARFGEWTEINSLYEGRFMERIAPGAFKKTISEGIRSMRVLFNHGKDVLGEQVLGPIRSLEEDEFGARYEVPLFPSVPDLVVDGLRAGQYGASFRFRVTREEFNDRAEESAHNPEGLPERTIKEAQVREFGPVTFPAYAGATAGIRSITDEMLMGRFMEQPELLRALLLKFLPDDSEQVVEEVAPTTTSAELSAHPRVVRRTNVPLFGLNTEEKPSWQL